MIDISNFILPHLSYSGNLSVQKTATSIAGSIFVKCPMTPPSYKIQERIFSTLTQNLTRGIRRPEFAKGSKQELAAIQTTIRSISLILGENKNLIRMLAENDTVYALVRVFEFEPSLLNRTISNNNIGQPSSATDSEISDGDLIFGRNKWVTRSILIRADLSAGVIWLRWNIKHWSACRLLQRYWNPFLRFVLSLL